MQYTKSQKKNKLKYLQIKERENETVLQKKN